MGKNNKTITLNSGQCKPSAHLCEQVNDLMDFVSKAKKEIGRSDELFIRHHINNKNSVFPFWVVCEVLTFYTISKYYNNMLKIDKTAISKKFYGVDRKYIENWLLVCSYIRNLYAHNARLYNRKFIQATVKLPKNVKASNSNLFDRLIPMCKMLCDEKKNRFIDELEELINNHPFAKKSIDFPNGWEMGNIKR